MTCSTKEELEMFYPHYYFTSFIPFLRECSPKGAARLSSSFATVVGRWHPLNPTACLVSLLCMKAVVLSFCLCLRTSMSFVAVCLYIYICLGVCLNLTYSQ